MRASMLTVVAASIAVFIAPADRGSVAVAQGVPVCGAEQRSAPTSCAEHDNVNIPLRGGSVSQFRIVATHPAYAVGVDNCQADFSGCPTGDAVSGRPAADDACEELFNDGITIVKACAVVGWWRPFSMAVVMSGGPGARGQYLVLYRKTDGEDNWPQIAVLYEDGNLRLKPHPPIGIRDTCLGSSVIVGPAPPAERPFVDIEQIVVVPSPLSLEVTYAGGLGRAHIDLSVNRTQAVATVQPFYNAAADVPVATFRSNWVVDGNADVDHLKNQDGDFPILADHPPFIGPSWFFHRAQRSVHNTSGPDIRVEISDRFPELLISLNQTTFGPRDTLTTTVTVIPGLEPTTVDAYLALQLPSRALLFMQPDGSLASTARPAVSGWTVDPVRAELPRYTFSGAEPKGTYTWLGALTQPSGGVRGCIGQAPFTVRP
jgi:hypothetical protein